MIPFDVIVIILQFADYKSYMTLKGIKKKKIQTNIKICWNTGTLSRINNYRGFDIGRWVDHNPPRWISWKTIHRPLQLILDSETNDPIHWLQKEKIIIK